FNWLRVSGTTWLRVFRSAKASHVGHGGRPQRQTSVGRAEKWGDSVAERGAGLRVIAAVFRPCAPNALTVPGAVFLSLCQEVRPMCNTRNQCSREERMAATYGYKAPTKSETGKEAGTTAATSSSSAGARGGCCVQQWRRGESPSARD